MGEFHGQDLRNVCAGYSFVGAQLRHANASKHKIIWHSLSYQKDPEKSLLSFSATCGAGPETRLAPCKLLGLLDTSR